MNYPPFCDIIYIVATGEDEQAVKEEIEKIGKHLDKEIKNDGNIFSKTGPGEAPISKIKNNYRYRILMKCKNADDAHELLRSIYEEYEKGRKSVFLTIDINPINMY